MPSLATSSPGELAGELVALNPLAICFMIHARGKFIPPASMLVSLGKGLSSTFMMSYPSSPL